MTHNKDRRELAEHAGRVPVDGLEHTSGSDEFPTLGHAQDERSILDDPCWCLHRRGSLPGRCAPEPIPKMLSTPIAKI